MLHVMQIIKATDVARLKGKKTVNVDDILFLLRKNKVLMPSSCNTILY